MDEFNYPIIKIKGSDVKIIPMMIPEKWGENTERRLQPYELVEMAVALCYSVSKEEHIRQWSHIKEVIGDKLER